MPTKSVGVARLIWLSWPTLLTGCDAQQLLSPAGGAGLAAAIAIGLWLGGRLISSSRKRVHRTITRLLVVLALGAVVGQTALQLPGALTGDYVRSWNVFHYYLGSKYFAELGYFELYPAVLSADNAWGAAQVERDPTRGPQRWKQEGFGAVPVSRDMHDYKIKPRVELVSTYDPTLLSPAQLEQLGQDARFLKPYLDEKSWANVFHDLGYNPAPAWTLIGTPLSRLIPARWPWFWLISNSDLPLYLAALLATWWAFGARITALGTFWVTAIQFNQGRFIGGFLQYDWLVSCILCLAFYRRGRHASAGLALSWGAMTRVFPGFLILPIVLKVGVDLARGVRWNRHSIQPPVTRSEPWSARIQRHHRRFLVAFAAACALLFVASHFTGRGLQTWPEWVAKISRHSERHAVTSNQRIGVGRLAQHHPGPKDFWGEYTGLLRTRLDAAHSRKLLLQGLGLLLLIPALLRRKDEDALILAMFSVLLLATLSRYYASVFVLTLALGISSTGPPEKAFSEPRAPVGWPRWAGLLAGTLLLSSIVAFALPISQTGKYFVVNYLYYGMFALLCVGYLLHDGLELRRRRQDKSPTPLEV